MTAPCAGFVWFRWVRPRTWHRWRYVKHVSGTNCALLKCVAGGCGAEKLVAVV